MDKCEGINQIIESYESDQPSTEYRCDNICFREPPKDLNYIICDVKGNVFVAKTEGAFDGSRIFTEVHRLEIFNRKFKRADRRVRKAGAYAQKYDLGFALCSYEITEHNIKDTLSKLAKTKEDLKVIPEVEFYSCDLN
jgi:hypothetical protein